MVRGRYSWAYSPPEFLQSYTYDYHMDMWAVGCVIYKLATGDLLSSMYNPASVRLPNDKTSRFPHNLFPFSGEAADFMFSIIQRLVSIAPFDRPTAHGLINELNKQEFDYTAECQDFAYSFEDKEWLKEVGNKVHHLRRLNVPSELSGSYLHVVNPLTVIITDRVKIKHVSNEEKLNNVVPPSFGECSNRKGMRPEVETGIPRGQ